MDEAFKKLPESLTRHDICRGGSNLESYVAIVSCILFADSFLRAGIVERHDRKTEKDGYKISNKKEVTFAKFIHKPKSRVKADK